MFRRFYRVLEVNVITAIMRLIPMRNTQARSRVPNSPAIPLPSASFGPEIPLSAGSANDIQITDLPQVFGPARAHFGDQSAFCPCSQGRKPGRGDRPARRRLRRLDEHVDAAGGDGELAPGFLINGHAVFDAFGAGEALGVAGDQHRRVRVLRRRPRAAIRGRSGGRDR